MSGCAAASACAPEFTDDAALIVSPRVLAVVAHLGGQLARFDAVPNGVELELTASWLAADQEQYPYFERAQQALVSKREAMSVAWYVSRGQLDTESTGVAEDDASLSTSNHWTAPRAPGAATLWLVLRDSRGGVDFATYGLRILP